MESLQKVMSAVMASQVIEDRNDTFVQDLKRVANKLAYGQNPETRDTSLIHAAELYLSWEEES